jgi:RNA polymerase sigma factor (sigma-70 family)
MNARELLTQLYTSDEIRELKQKLEPKHLAEDIIQHVFTEMYTKPDSFLEDLVQRQKFKPYIVKQIWNTCYYRRTPFSQAYGLDNETPTDFCDNARYEVIRYESEPSRVDKEKQMHQLRTMMGEMHWYKARVFELYAELGTYRAVSEITGIPTTSVYRTVQELKKELKQKL